MLINNSTSGAIHRWQPACWLKVSGEDAANFLQGQFTNDLRRLPQERAVYGLWLTVKGKVLADSFVLRDARKGEFWIGSYFSPASIIRERLENHVIADDVTIEDFTGGWIGVSLLDGLAAKVGVHASEAAPGILFTGRRDAGPSIECVYPIAAGEPPLIANVIAAAPMLDAIEMERRRIGAGIPAVPMDVGPGDLPNEAGLEEAAISYTKGCYLGQEVMARLKSMGQVRRRLLRVRGTGAEIPAVPSPVFVESRQVGELRSVVREGAGDWSGLAMVSLLHVRAGTDLALIAGGTATVRLVDSP
jgi:tRNA-modifying protein YgfZ